MLKIHSETNFSQTQTQIHTHSVNAAHCTCHCRNGRIFFIQIHTYTLYIYISIYEAWSIYVGEVMWFKDINQTHWYDAGHDFGIFKIDRLKMWIFRKFTLVLVLPFRMDENAYVCVYECLCFMCFVYSLCSIRHSSAVDLFLICTKTVCVRIAKGLLVSYALLWLGTTVCANGFRKLIKILAKKSFCFSSRCQTLVRMHINFCLFHIDAHNIEFQTKKRDVRRLINIHVSYVARQLRHSRCQLDVIVSHNTAIA